MLLTEKEIKEFMGEKVWYRNAEIFAIFSNGTCILEHTNGEYEVIYRDDKGTFKNDFPLTRVLFEAISVSQTY